MRTFNAVITIPEQSSEGKEITPEVVREELVETFAAGMDWEYEQIAVEVKAA